jgi:hypothetical protein
MLNLIVTSMMAPCSSKQSFLLAVPGRYGSERAK